MAKEILTDDGQLEEVDMDEAKDDNKKLGMPAIDDEEGREDSEPDGEGGTKKTSDPKTKKSKASAKAENKKAKKEQDDDEEEDDEEDVEEGKSKKEQDDDYEDDEEDDEEETESKKSKKESKKSKKEAMPPWLDKDKDDDDDEEEKESKKSKKEDIDVDVSEDVAALVDGEDLSEEFKTKAATIFEAAVKSKISKIRKQIREDSKKYLEVKTTSMQEEMTEKMDEYMNYVVKESWKS